MTWTSSCCSIRYDQLHGAGYIQLKYKAQLECMNNLTLSHHQHGRLKFNFINTNDLVDFRDNSTLEPITLTFLANYP